MDEKMIKAIPKWEGEYLRMNKNLTDREKEILKGDLIKSAFITSSMGVSYKLKLGKNI